MSAVRTRILSAVFWIGIGQVAAQLLSLVLFLVLARFVSKESFGTVAVALIIVEIGRRLLIEPIGLAVYSRPDVTQTHYDEAFTLTLIVAFVATTALVLFAVPLTAAIGSPGAGPPLRLLTPMLFALAMSSIPAATLSRRGLFRDFALRAMLSISLGGAIGIGMAITGWSMWSLVGQQVAISVINAIALWTAARWQPHIAVSRDGATWIIGKARHISASALWNTAAQESDLLIVSAMFGPAMAGVYNAAKRIMLSINLLLVSAVSSLMLPTLANAATPAERSATFLASFRFVSMVSAPAFIGLSILSADFVDVILGPRWAQAGPILGALVPSGYVLSLSQITTSLLLVCDRQSTDARCAIVAAILSIAALTATIPLGPVGMAASLSVAIFLVLLLKLRFALVEIGAAPATLAMAVLPSIVPAMVMGLVVVIAHILANRAGLDHATILVLGVPAGALVYVLALRALSPRLFTDAWTALRSHKSLGQAELAAQ